jgi:hypothetical protein
MDYYQPQQIDWSDVDTMSKFRRFMIAFLDGKIANTPWHGTPVDPETLPLLENLRRLHRLGFITIQGQLGTCNTTPIRNPEGDYVLERQRPYVIGFYPESTNLVQFVRELTTRGLVVLLPGQDPVGYDSFPLEVHERTGARGYALTMSAVGDTPDSVLQRPKFNWTDTFHALQDSDGQTFEGSKSWWEDEIWPIRDKLNCDLSLEFLETTTPIFIFKREWCNMNLLALVEQAILASGGSGWPIIGPPPSVFKEESEWMTFYTHHRRQPRRPSRTRKSSRGHSAKWESCVRQVKRQPSAINPFAICAKTVGW